MSGRSRFVGAAALLWLAAGGSELVAQQAGRATGQTVRDFDRRDGRRSLGDVLGAGTARGYARGQLRGGLGWQAGWSWPAGSAQVLCRPVGAVGRSPAPGQAFLAECSSAPLGYYGGVLGGAGAYGYVGQGAYGTYGYGGYGAYGGYRIWPPPPIVLPREERPHRFYSEYHPSAAGSGVPPLTCDPRPGAPCPPVGSTSAPVRAPLPQTPGGSAAGGLLVSDCAEVTARGVTGVVYRGRASLAVLGAERPEDAALAIEAALARGSTVALIGEHGYPVYLPPATFLESVESRACRR